VQLVNIAGYASVDSRMTLRRLTQRLAIIACAAACAVAALPVAMATVMRAMDLSELTASADQIVVGDVVSTESSWDTGHRNIYSTIDINVQESWKGATPGDGRIRIRQLGGTVGDIEMTVYGMAQFTPGERALLFLRQARVVGMGQGKRLVHWDSAGKQWLVDAPDLSRVLGVDGQGRPRASETNQPEALNRLRERVRAMVGN
jgi:hypothetical protein